MMRSRQRRSSRSRRSAAWPAAALAPQMIEAPAPLVSLPAPVPAALCPGGRWRWLAYMFALVPPVGITLGLLFSPNADPGARRFGRICFLLALAGFFCAAAAFGCASETALGERYIEHFY